MDNAFGHILAQIIHDFGVTILADKKVVNILADYGCKERPMLKMMGDSIRLNNLQLSDFISNPESISSRLYSYLTINCGYSPSLVRYFLDCVAFGIGAKTTHPISLSAPEQRCENNNSTSHTNKSYDIVSFMGVPLGSHYTNFKNAIKIQSGKFIQGVNSKYEFHIPNFIDIDNWELIIDVHNSGIVSKIQLIQKSYSLTQRLRIVKRIVELYSIKYGFPQSSSTWLFEPIKIQIRSSFNLGNNVAIEYSFIDTNMITQSLVKFSKFNCPNREELEYCMGKDKLNFILQNI